MSRPAVAHIRLDAFRHNYRVAKHHHGGKALAVIKANGYGHGAVQCAQAIENEADGFAVAAIEEALELRQAGIKQPILLLEGFFEAAELPEIVTNDLWIVIHHQWQVEVLLSSKLEQPLQVWLKMDSGMHRAGLAPSEFATTYERLSKHPNVANVVLMSHFANADNLSSSHTSQQITVFQQAIKEIKQPTVSLANSAAILGWKNAHSDWARPGIMLYGADPLFQPETPLRSVMQLTSRIISVRKIAKGESLGYGSIF
ncbi:MAG: alanine racemase, partial [Methylophilales bacterium]|nr:alanine racemase [Methylophilales bacterium]